MKAKIEVEDRKEADLIRRGLAHKETRALVKVVGALSRCPSDQSKRRVLNFVTDYFREHNEQ